MKLLSQLAFLILISLLSSACMFHAKIDSISGDFSTSEGSKLKPNVSILSSSTSIEESSSGIIDLTVELNAESDEDIVISFTLEGTAIGEGQDYTLLTPSPLTIPKGSKVGKIQLQITNDGISDPDETIVIKIQDNENLTLTASSTINLVLTEPPPLIISSTKIVDNSSFSYVDIDVDWSRGLAYLASRKTGVCLNVVDFNNQLLPTLVKSVGSGALQVCLGVKLFDNDKKVLLSSNSSNKIAAWDLTTNPTDYVSWYQLGEYALGTNGKRVSKVESTGVNTWNIYTTKLNGIIKASLSVSGSVGTFSLLNNYTPAGLSFNAATILGNRVLAQSYTGSIQPVNQLNLSLVAQSTDTTAFWGWTAVTNPAGTKAFLGGAPGGAAFYGDDAGTVSLKKKLLMTSSCMVRSADFASQGVFEYLYVLCSDGFINVFDVTDISSPILIRVGQILPIETEAYGIKIKPNSDLGIVVTNRGDFIVINLQGLLTPASQYPADP